VKGQNNAIRGHSDRSKFIIKEVINVYPDTSCWVHDFTYSFNEPMTENYFWHPAYDDYPVVGVTWSRPTPSTCGAPADECLAAAER
jgi:sulfatase modifying factor 1